MKKLLLALLLCFGLLSISPFFSLSPMAMADDTDTEEDSIAVCEDVYDIKIVLKVPQVLENSTSSGYRKYKVQIIKGKMYVVWLDNGGYRLEFGELENKKFQVGGRNVTYKGAEDRYVLPSSYTYIGDNKTGVFKTPALCFFLELLPSYAITDPTEDNSFYLTISGSGNSEVKKSIGCRVATKFYGRVAGTQGCSCSDYGHKSPTRVAASCGPSYIVVDPVATYGHWYAKWKGRCYCK